MSPMAIDYAADIARAVHELKVDRDTWKAIATQYKAAFEAQTSRLHELQDITFATQAEWENERAQQRPSDAASDSTSSFRPRGGVQDDGSHFNGPTSGIAPIILPRKVDVDRPRRFSEECTNPLFKRVQQSVGQRNYGTALAEIESLLRGPLSSKARAEGLLLKSNILRAAGPEELYEAMAACSEADELCRRLNELEAFLPRIQYQRGIICYELHLLKQAKDAISTVSDDDLLTARVTDFHDEDDDGLHIDKRRSGFDENRTLTEFLVMPLRRSDGRIRRTSMQLRQLAASKAHRMSLPYRWVNSKSDG